MDDLRTITLPISEAKQGLIMKFVFPVIEEIDVFAFCLGRQNVLADDANLVYYSSAHRAILDTEIIPKSGFCNYIKRLIWKPEPCPVSKDFAVWDVTHSRTWHVDEWTQVFLVYPDKQDCQVTEIKFVAAVFNALQNPGYDTYHIATSYLEIRKATSNELLFKHRFEMKHAAKSILKICRIGKDELEITTCNKIYSGGIEDALKEMV